MPRRRKRIGAKNNAGAIAAIVLCFVIIAGSVAYLWREHNPIDPITGCSIDTRRIENTYAFLIDSTDQFSEIHNRKIERLIESIMETTQVEDRFQIYRMTESESKSIEPVFNRCHSDTSITESPALANFRRLDFQRNLQQSLAVEGEARLSPILHAINAVSVEVPQDSSQKHLIIVSDFYEHSSTFSLYNASISEVLELNPEVIASHLPDLSEFNVYLQVIDRPELNQNRQLVEGWIELLERSRATMRSTRLGNDESEYILDVAVRVTG